MTHPLDDRPYVTRFDPKGMLTRTDAFPEQCDRALDIATKASLDLGDVSPAQVVVTGLGGSAAGGDFARALCDAQAPVPLIVSRDYHVPAFVGPNTLVFATSYSGNTEETLSAYADAKGRNAPVVAITSGGKLADLARENGDPLIIIPGGQPPRTALGYLLVPVVVALERIGILPAQPWHETFRVLREGVDQWTAEAPVGCNVAKGLALALHGNLSVLYGRGSWQAIVANRWKGQINENAKNMTFANAFPELCHNEILGWVKATEQGVKKWVGVVLSDGNESEKMKTRDMVTRELTYGIAEWHEVHALGNSLLEKLLSLTLLGDYVSLYLACLNQVDPENIDSINILKDRLSKVPA
ncbi:MAG: hypothetical protein HONBIEJF_00526 [Fimbriimonadaceae bacterium]|nr:hypothetical protein [Fimbriimonadaceae bacterium]